MDNATLPATKGDLRALRHDIEKLVRQQTAGDEKSLNEQTKTVQRMLDQQTQRVQKMLDQQTKDIGREFRVALEHSESHLRGAKTDQIAVLETDVHRLKVAVFGRADRPPHDGFSDPTR